METIELVFGTYENLILGYKIVSKLDGKYGLETSFSDDAHRGALRCLAISPSGVLASSSTDDSIRLHNLKKRKEIGGLFEHSGTVNCLTFYKGSHMFSASEDGTICMWKSKNWEMLRTLKGHKSHVMAVAVHPSGKLALSVGSDKSFLTWDLVTGKLAFQRKIGDVAQNILFTRDGDRYVLVYQRKLEICSLEDTKTVQELPIAWRINAVCYVQDNILAVGGDDRYVLLIDIQTGKHTLTLDMAKPEDGSFKSRVKSICVLDYEEDQLVMVALASGDFKVFRLKLQEKKSELILFYETKLRVTCMTVYRSTNTESKVTDDKSKTAGDVQESVKDKFHKKKIVKDEDSDDEMEVNDSDDIEDEEEGVRVQKAKRQQKLPQALPQHRKRKRQNEHEEDEDDDSDEDEGHDEIEEETNSSKQGKQAKKGKQKPKKTKGEKIMQGKKVKFPAPSSGNKTKKKKKKPNV